MKKFYKKFLDGHKGKVHLLAHSHHFWPDASLKGHKKYWMDSAKLSDKKWQLMLGKKLKETQKMIGSIINFNRPSDIAFAPNTHELVFRLFSCFFGKKNSIKVVSTNSEFHSFQRQLDALVKASMATSVQVDVLKANFESEFLKACTDADFVFISQVFFNNGIKISNEFIKDIVNSSPKDAIICVDGYHGFCAVETDISSFSDRVFYLAGGYKYAQAGEGMCFLTLPKDCKLEPVYTGWFANYSGLENKKKNDVGYQSDGMRFWGSTQDLSSHYRFQSVWKEFAKNKIKVATIDRYVKELQKHFIHNCKCTDRLLETDISRIGHFLTFNMGSTQKAQKAHDLLLEADIMTDYRGSSLRLGFGPYMDSKDLKKTLKMVNSKGFEQIFE